MKPFSPLYFIKENRQKCLLLILMLILSYGVFLGGLYVTSPKDSWSLAISYYDNMTTISPSNYDTIDEYNTCMDIIKANENIISIPRGTYNAFNWNNVMGFEDGQFSFTFLSVDDFKAYCENKNISCDFDNLKNGSMIMSERFSKNRNLHIGDVVDKNYASNIYDTYTLDAITDEKGYTLYFIAAEPESTGNYILMANGISGKEFYEYLHNLQKEYDIYLYEELEDNITEQYETLNLIYFFVLVLLSIILAVTINASFVGMYQRRNHEYAIYRAIGISKRRIMTKIITELLWMDIIALVIGGVIGFIGLYLFNNLVLYPVGKYLQYFHPLALFGLILCHIIVLVPLMITRIRQMFKADICEY